MSRKLKLFRWTNLRKKFKRKFLALILPIINRSLIQLIFLCQTPWQTLNSTISPETALRNHSTSLLRKSCRSWSTSLTFLHRPTCKTIMRALRSTKQSTKAIKDKTKINKLNGLLKRIINYNGLSVFRKVRSLSNLKQ